MDKKIFPLGMSVPMPPGSTDRESILGIRTVEVPNPSDEEIMGQYSADIFSVDAKGNKILNENVFAEAFCEVNHLRYSHGLFYTRNGKASEEMVARDIWDSLRQEDFGFTTDMERRTKKLLGTVKLAATVEKLEARRDLIPFANGDLDLTDWTFYEERYNPSPYRLPAVLPWEAPPIPYFSKWLKDLFYPEDIPIIQEYLGGCLVPVTRTQKALFLVGEGGAGKSVLGAILQAMLGEAMISTQSTKEFLADKFKLPELEHKLVLYDDDLDSAALGETGFYKKLITNSIPITADRKYSQAFQFTPYAKLVSCCNQMLTSMYDHTGGFYRRLLPILVKPVAQDFQPDRDFYSKVATERDGIAFWALMGLRCLMDNGWELTESQRSRDYLQSHRSQGCHFPDFIQDVMEFGPERAVSSRDLTAAYRLWCQRNAVEPRKDKTLLLWIGDNEARLGVKKSKHVQVNGQHLRGYNGMNVKKSWNLQGRISFA